jgi:fructokinase
MVSMKIPSIVGIGELLWDELPTGPRLGGATTNFAVFSARLGNRVSLVSKIGSDAFGREAKQILAEPSLALDDLQISAKHPTGTVEVQFSPQNQPRYTIGVDVAWDFIEWTPPLLNLASTTDAVYFGTLSQRHLVSRTTIRRFVEATPGSCVRVCDVNLRMPWCSSEVLVWSMRQATVLKISDEELSPVFALLGESLPQIPASPGGAKDAADRLLEHFPGCALVAVTLGAHGCLIATRQQVHQHPGFLIQPVDPVGAGDAFSAGLVHSYLRSASLPAMAEVGNLCGSYVASQHGATPKLPASLIQRIALLLGNEHSQTPAMA